MQTKKNRLGTPADVHICQHCTGVGNPPTRFGPKSNGTVRPRRCPNKPSAEATALTQYVYIL